MVLNSQALGSAHDRTNGVDRPGQADPPPGTTKGLPGRPEVPRTMAMTDGALSTADETQAADQAALTRLRDAVTRLWGRAAV